MTNTVNEKSMLCITLSFKDCEGLPLVPATVEWRLDDTKNSTELVDWTALTGTMESTMKMVVPASNNTIVDETNNREPRILGIRINVGLDSEAHDQYKYHIINLTGTLSA